MKKQDYQALFEADKQKEAKYVAKADKNYKSLFEADKEKEAKANKKQKVALDCSNPHKTRNIIIIAGGLIVICALVFGVGYLLKAQPIKTVEPIPKLACEYLIAGGTVVDGKSAEPYIADVAIDQGLIVGVGDLQNQVEAGVVIDARGKVVTPGFIDLHTHTEEYWSDSPDGTPALFQGITTEIGGNCGTSVPSVGDYLTKLTNNGTAINIGMFTGYKVLRYQAGVKGQANPAQIIKMQELLAASLKEGSFGFSTGLGYPPQNLATTEELTALAKTLKSYNRLFALHSRNEYENVEASMDEAIAIAKSSGVRFQYSHVKAAGEANWAKMPIVLQKLDNAVAAGMDIKSDIYGYTFSSNDFGQVESMAEANVVLGLKNPNVMVASDGGLYRGGRANYPRAYANCVRILEKYVKTDQVLTLSEAVQKMTWQPAQRLNITDRGLIALGKKADLNIFVLDNLHETATRENPMSKCQGMDYVFVNGKPAISQGELTGIMAGEALHSK